MEGASIDVWLCIISIWSQGDILSEMTDLPVFQSVGALRLWKRIHGERASRLRRNDTEDLGEIAKEVIGCDGSVHPAILSELILRMSESPGGIKDETLKALVSKSRTTDAMPSVTAARIARKKGDTSLAAEVLAMSSGSQEIRNRGLELAEVYLAEGDEANARETAEKVYGADPDCIRAYEILTALDPDGGWAQRRNIRDIMNGDEPGAPAGTGRLQELYSVYYDWFRGRRESATSRLVASDYYKDHDPEFMLASARFSVDERDWHSAGMVYSEIVDSSPQYVRCEAAEAFLNGGDPAKALELFESADITLPRVKKGRIAVLARLGEHREMMNRIRAYLDSESVCVPEYLDFVRMLMDMGLYDDAESLLAKVVDIYPDDPSFLTFESEVRMQHGDIPAAMRAAREAVLRGRDNVPARLQKARMHLVLGKAEAAEKECLRVLSGDPKNREALLLKKDIAVFRNDYHKAASVCEEILESDPSDTETLKALASAHCEMGDRDGAQDVLMRCLSADPSLDNSLDVLGIMLSRGMFRDAVFACHDVEREFPDNVSVKRLKGNAEYGSGDFMKASVTFSSALKTSPDDPVLWHSKGMADESRGDLQSALDSYNRALMLDLREPRYWISKSAVQEKLGDRSGAMQSLDRVLALDPGSVYALVREAWIHAADSRFDEAVGCMEKAVSAEPEDADVRLEMMRVLHRAGRYGDAVEFGKNPVSAGDQRATALASECLVEMGMHKEAAGMLKEGLDSDPESEVLQDAVDRMKGIPGRGSEEAPESEETAEVQPREEPEDLAAMAASLLDAGDRRGAVRAIDRALAEDPDNTDYILIKARAVLASGDRSAATVIVSNALRTDPDVPALHEMLGDLRVLSGDHRGAVQEYETALSEGADTSALYNKMGEAYERTGDTDRAVECYSVVMDRGDGSQELGQRMVRVMFSRGDTVTAGRYIDGMLEADRGNAAAWVFRAELCKSLGDGDGVMESYRGFMSCDVRGADSTVRMVKLMEETGHPDEASEIMGEKKPRGDADKSVKRNAEKVMRRAFATKTPLDDPDLVAALGLEDGLSEQVSEYLADIPEYGRITPGTDDFQFMERKAHDIVMKLKWTDLEGSPMIPLEKVFVAGSYKDADEAKEMAAYIYKVMHYDVGRKAAGRITMMSMRLPRGMSVYDVMKECDVGVYEAKQVLAQIV